MRPLYRDFEDHVLVTFDLDGRPAWLARHIGDLAGYAERGRRLVTKIRRDWQAELLEGHDLVSLRGSQAEMLRAVLGPVLVPGASSTVEVLLEPGLHVVLGKCSIPAGKRLRAFILDTVLPEWGRGPLVTSAPPTESVDLLVERERRLRGRLDLDDRRFRSTTLRRAGRVLRDLGQIDDVAYGMCEVVSAQIALGVPLPELISPLSAPVEFPPAGVQG